MPPALSRFAVVDSTPSSWFAPDGSWATTRGGELRVDYQVNDRPPVGLWGHSFLDEWSPRRLAAATVAAQRRYGWDFVKEQPHLFVP